MDTYFASSFVLGIFFGAGLLTGAFAVFMAYRGLDMAAEAIWHRVRR